MIQDLERLRGEYATLQRHYKQASLDLMQARLVVKNIGDASSADAELVAAADASDAAARSGNRASLTEAVASGAASTSGSVTPPVRPVSEAAPSAADGQSSASSYMPIGLAQALGGGTRGGGAGGALPATMQLSAQLANVHVKLKIERQRADAAEAQVRQLQQQLAVASGGPAPAIDSPIIRDKLTGVLQVRPKRHNHTTPLSPSPANAPCQIHSPAAWAHWWGTIGVRLPSCVGVLSLHEGLSPCACV